MRNLNGRGLLAVSEAGDWEAITGINSGDRATIYAENKSTANWAPALNAISIGNGPTGNFKNNGTGTALWASSSASNNNTAYIENTGTGGALYVKSAGQNNAWFENTGTGNNIAVGARAVGVWPAAQFENANGPALRTIGSADIVGTLQAKSTTINGDAVVNGHLQINGNYAATGSKTAIVPTSRGMQKMYTEESSEVWFTDYGKGQLVGGKVWVPIDASFSETIDLRADYHVFVQPYADAALYVEEGTDGFWVKASTGDQNAKFSYRLVAKRKGYANDRMEKVKN